MSVRIAISQRVVLEPAHNELRDALAHDWYLFFEEILPTALLFAVPNVGHDVAGWIDSVNPSALILSGGNDIGESLQRDETEKKLVAFFRERSRPVLGVCRGMQLLNVIFGGRVTPQCAATSDVSHVAATHTIQLSGPAFQRAAGGGSVEVNSFHNHGVTGDGLAPSLKSFAESADGCIEGIFHPAEPLMGIQWHPERTNPVTTFDRALVTHLFENGRFWT